MESHHIFSQLVLLALLWLFVIVHLSWPKRLTGSFGEIFGGKPARVLL